MKIILRHGGYQELKSYRKSVIVYDGTHCFIRRFLRSSDRTCDQMVQAARSGKQNIIEGSMASAVSKETEIKLTGVRGLHWKNCLKITVIICVFAIIPFGIKHPVRCFYSAAWQALR